MTPKEISTLLKKDIKNCSPLELKVIHAVLELKSEVLGQKIVEYKKLLTSKAKRQEYSCTRRIRINNSECTLTS